MVHVASEQREGAASATLWWRARGGPVSARRGRGAEDEDDLGDGLNEAAA